jgi:hypothetical protein
VNSKDRPSLRRPAQLRGAALLAVAIAMLAIFASPPAAATSETLRRSAGNILFAPFDVATSPASAGKALYANLQQTDDPRWMRVAFALPGYVWMLGVEIGGGAIREIAGLLELVPGVGLLCFDSDLDPLFEPVEHNDALLDLETPPLRIKLGVNYLASLPYP